MILAQSVLLALEVLLLVAVAARRGFSSVRAIVFAAATFYGSASLLDWLIFGIPAVGPNEGVYVDSAEHAIGMGLYFLFLLGFAVVSLLHSGRIAQTQLDVQWTKKPVSLLAAAASTLVLFIISNWQFGLTRAEANALLESPFVALCYSTCLYCIICVGCDAPEQFHWLRKGAVAVLLFTVLASFQREPLLIAVLTAIHRRKASFLSTRAIWALALMLPLMFFYKPFVTHVVHEGDWQAFLGSTAGLRGGLASADPAGSFFVLCKCVTDPIYDDFGFSYVTNLYRQISRVALGVSYESLGERASMVYTNGTYGLGFSMIAEAFLNGNFAGPLLLGCMVAGLLGYVETAPSRVGGIRVIACFIAIRLIRSEVAVLLKLNLLPIVIAIFCFYRIRAVRTSWGKVAASAQAAGLRLVGLRTGGRRANSLTLQ